MEKLKEEIKHLRFWLGVYIAISLTLGSWIVSHLNINFKFILACIVEIAILYKIYVINKKINEKITQLGDE